MVVQGRDEATIDTYPNLVVGSDVAILLKLIEREQANKGNE